MSEEFAKNMLQALHEMQNEDLFFIKEWISSEIDKEYEKLDERDINEHIRLAKTKDFIDNIFCKLLTDKNFNYSI